MRRTALTLVGIALVAALCALAGTPHRAASQGPGGPGGQGGPGGPGGPGRPPGMMAMAPDSFAADRDSLVQLVLERIKGRENAPAESVFKNVQLLKGRTAMQLLRGMNGWGRSLGVPCSHCHVENHWAEDDKQPKQSCRNMVRMVTALNDSLIPQYKWPKDDTPHVGCFTCHRGHANPNFGMGRPPGAGGGRPEGDHH